MAKFRFTHTESVRVADQVNRMRTVLLIARRQLITLGGDREWGFRDEIHAAVLDQIDKVLGETQYE